MCISWNRKYICAIYHFIQANQNKACRHQILATSTLETRPSLSFLILRRAYVPGPWLEIVDEFLIVESYANLSPGDPARVDDHTVLNLPHEVAQVRGEKQQMWRPGTISYKKTRVRKRKRPVHRGLALQLFIVYVHLLRRRIQWIERPLEAKAIAHKQSIHVK